ncbi:LysE family transporter [Rhodobacter capsulatus]|uniref:LysE family transporter n=1 Tax=Rhodobacter capsulatus TaxID=1061 RepID=UPI0040273B9A
MLGIICGTALWGQACLFGIAFVFATAPWAFMALRWIGAACLVMPGLTLLRTWDSQDGQ